MVLRQPSLSLWHLATVLLKIYIPLALSVSDCPECRPLDLQRAPGVGIDLTMAYVTASIRFRNGTTRPLAVINGTAEYRAAMQLIVEEGMNPEDTPWPLPAQSQQNTFVPSKGWGWWIPWVWTWSPFKAARSLPKATYPDPIPIPDHYTAIGSMLATLKLSVLDPLEPPLKYNSVYLSVPDIPNADWHYTRRFELPCSLAGLEMLGGRVATSHALRYNGVKDWVGPGDEPPPHIDFFYPRNMLTISYNAASLGITLSTRDAGWLFTGGRVHQSTRLGADNVNKIMGYWDEVRKLSANIIGNAAVDYTLLIGSHAHDRGLVQAVEGVIAGCENINPSVLDRYIQGSASEEDKQEALFASANQAAVPARFGMLTGYEACLVPEHCLVDEDNEFEEVDWWSILGIPNTEGIN